MSVKRETMANPKFELVNWYNNHRARHFSARAERRPSRDARIGDAIALVSHHLLEDGIFSCYPDITPIANGQQRFIVMPETSERKHYLIKDSDLETEFKLSTYQLESRTFNLVAWYKNQIDSSGCYDKKYEAGLIQIQEKILEIKGEDVSPLTPSFCIPLSPRESQDGSLHDLQSVASTSEDPESLPGLQEMSECSDEDDEYSHVDEIPTSTSDRKALVETISDDSEVLTNLLLNPNGENEPDPEERTSQLPTASLPSETDQSVKPDLDEGLSDDESDWGVGSRWCNEYPVIYPGNRTGVVKEPMGKRIAELLERCQPYPGDNRIASKHWRRFRVEKDPDGFFDIYDKDRGIETYLHATRLWLDLFSIGKWYAEHCARESGHLVPGSASIDWLFDQETSDTLIGTPMENRAEELLERGAPFPQEMNEIVNCRRFMVHSSPSEPQHYLVHDSHRGVTSYLPKEMMEHHYFNICDWYEFRLAQIEMDELTKAFNHISEGSSSSDEGPSASNLGGHSPSMQEDDLLELFESENRSLGISAVQVDRNKYPAVQQNAASVKDKARVLPKPVVLKVQIQGHPARALVDSGSQGDFVSTTLADQLKLNKGKLESPLKLLLAVQGSRSVINYEVETRFQYEGIDETRRFDVINLNNYDIILGTPWIYQHQVCIGLNPARILIGSNRSLPIKRGLEAKLLAGIEGFTLGNEDLGSVREELLRYAQPLCREVEETNLPPLRVINHSIPLIDEAKIYPWRPSKCPEAFRAQWAEKRNTYLKSGRWEITSAGNTVPMLLIPKPRKNGQAPELRTVFDLWERNKNTRKLTSPLPNMEAMLRRAAKHKYRTVLDLKSAYEQIRVIPEHVNRTAVTTPDGNMLSHVIQQGDCNAPATYQALMNHLFSAHIGKCMDVYLDDIVIYSDTLEQHRKDVKAILDILDREKLYSK